jgi:GTP-binding protein
MRDFNEMGPSGSMSHGSGREGVNVKFMRGIKGSDDILNVPWPQIAFVGRSNVGKSSTINALLNGRFTRVSATPGKTTEINFYNVDDHLFVVDLPGYGYARLPIPTQHKIRQHILWYLTSPEVYPNLRTLVMVTDAKAGITQYDRELMEVAHEEKLPLLVILNKTDKLNQSERSKLARAFEEEFPGQEYMMTSAEKKTNITKLFERLSIK